VRAREGLVAAAIVLSIPPFFWLDGWWWSWGMTDDPRAIFQHPFAHHQYLEKPAFDYLAEQRASELKAGDRVVFDEGIIFVGALWNFQFSNTIQYVPYATHPSATDFLTTVRALDAKWVAAGTEGAQAALRNSRNWEFVGKLSPVGEQQVFRRVGTRIAASK
jgi:hypothetical protein